MNKLKNIGISALAGSLVSLSAAQAGGVAISGSYELSYTNLNHSKVTGNKIGMNKNLSFGAGGDLSDGGGVTWAYSVGGSDAFGLSSASMNINMGGIATLAYDSGTGGYGANAVDNVVPTAWEEIDYGLSTGITDVGAVSASKGVINLTVKAPVSGTALSLSYVGRMGGTHQGDGATGEASGGRGIDAVIDFVNYNSAHFGMRFGTAAQIEVLDRTCEGTKVGMTNTSCDEGTSLGAATHKNHPYAGTMYYTMKVGPLSLGTQATFKDPQQASTTGIANKRSIVAGAALSFGDTISVSYGEGVDRIKYNNAARGCGDGSNDPSCAAGGEYEKISFRGYSAAINFGPLALKGTKNWVGGWGENSGNTGEGLQKSHSEINLSLAF